MDQISIAYRQLRTNELTRSQYDFSKRWLGKCQSYYSWLKSKKAEPSIDLLARLVYRLEDRVEHIERNPDPHFPELSAHDAELLRGLIGGLSIELKRRCLVDDYAAAQGC